MDKELKWRIVFGYGPSDYLSIGEAEIEKAIYAFKTGKIYKNIRGSEIKRIVPDFRFYTGWFDTYEPSDSEDKKQMLRDMPPQMLFEDREREANMRVQFVIAKNNPSLLADVSKIDQLLLA
jgi:hypothetical protein